LSDLLAKMRKDRHDRWIRDWSDGLASCYHCDTDYTIAEIVVINEEKSCPHCKNPEHKTYYYCKEHGSSNDDCER
jgi:hypothetical protein